MLEKKIKLAIFDIAGQERFKRCKEGYIKGSSVIAYFFDSTRLSTSLSDYEEMKKIFNKTISNYTNKIIYFASKIEKEEVEDKDAVIANLESIVGTKVHAYDAKSGHNFGIVPVKIAEKIKELYPNSKDLPSQLKVTFGGTGGAGKSTCGYKLVTGKYIEDTDMTIGAEFHEVELTIMYENEEAVAQE